MPEAAAEAILLVGGKGTRLRPLTLRTAKPMLPVAGVPFITHQLARLRDAGIEHVVLATSYRAEEFAAHVGDGRALGLRVEHVTEDEPMGTGGAMRNVVDRLEGGGDDPVVVLNGDVLSGHDLPGQLARHAAAGADVTLHLVTVEDPRAFGCVPTDDSGRVTAFMEKDPDPVTDQVNAGCYVVRRRVLESIPAGRPVSVERETFPGLLADGAHLEGFVDPAYWLDIGSPSALVAASRDLVLGRVRSSALPRAAAGHLLLPGAHVDPAAHVSGGTTLGRDAVVGAGAVIEGSVVGDGARVDPGAVVRASVVGPGAVVGEGAVLDEAVVGDGARVGRGNELRAGARVWVDVVLPDLAVRFSSDV